jgi:hypothetical protein
MTFATFLRALLFALPGVLVADNNVAYAWGGEGHRVTGYIAESLLTPKTRLRLHQLTGGASLDQLATYMDEHRLDLGPRVRKWHYDNMPVCGTASVEAYCRDGNCASQQINRLIDVLNNPASSSPEKQQSVLYLSHLIGDLHQPLHAGDNGDLGGNGVSIIGGRYQSRHHRNLHGEWDSTFVKSQVRGRSEAEFAAELVHAGRAHIKGFEQGSGNEWLKESNRIARDFVYGRLPGFRCDEVFTSTSVTVEYAKDAGEIVREQLLKAGVRMAWVLNSALGQ